MRNHLQITNTFRMTLLLAGMSLFCIILSLIKVQATGSAKYLFLNWNLFLAAIPWLLTTLMQLRGTAQKNTPLLIATIVAWVLFFPNSPYILTDLFHLKLMESTSAWFDLILILSFAWTGLIFGFQSLMDMEKLTQNMLTKRQTSILVTVFFFVVSFGVYLGRYVRWNSWDIINNPLGLFGDIVHRFMVPSEHPRTWGMTVLFGVLLNMMYWSIKFLKSENDQSTNP